MSLQIAEAVAVRAAKDGVDLVDDESCTTDGRAGGNVAVRAWIRNGSVG